MAKRAELPAVPVVDEQADDSAALAALAGEPSSPPSDAPAHDSPAEGERDASRNDAALSSASPDVAIDAASPSEPGKRKRGRPPGPTGASYRTLRTKTAMRDKLREQDRRIHDLEKQNQALALAQSQEAALPLAQGLGMILDFTFRGIAATRHSDAWVLPASKREEIATPLAQWAAPYLAEQAQYIPLYVAGAGLGSHVLTALAAEKQAAAAAGGARSE